MVDELGDLERDLAPWKPKIARAEALRKALRAPYKDADPNATFTLDGERWRAIVNPAGNETYVDKSTLLKLIGSVRFAELASVTVAALSQVTADIAGAVTKQSQTGTRKLSLVLLSALKLRRAG